MGNVDCGNSNWHECAIVGANASAESLKAAGGDVHFYLLKRLYLKGFFRRLLCFTQGYTNLTVCYKLNSPVCNVLCFSL